MLLKNFFILITVLLNKIPLFYNVSFYVYKNNQYRNQSENLEREFGEQLSPFHGYGLIYKEFVIRYIFYNLEVKT